MYNRPVANNNIAWTVCIIHWMFRYRDVIMSSMASQITSLNRLFGCRTKKTSKLRFTCLCDGNSLVTGEFPTQRASNAENNLHLMTSSWSCKLTCQRHDGRLLGTTFETLIQTIFWTWNGLVYHRMVIAYSQLESEGRTLNDLTDILLQLTNILLIILFRELHHNGGG